ncbi:unnamed protein product [Rhizophagus irregularis]|nr:unnamed protein product [Rhizophagus irregularis]
MQFEAGLATLFDMKSVEEENCPKKLSSDKFRRLNHRRLYFCWSDVWFVTIISGMGLFRIQTKEKFVTYFKSKEKVVAAENKNRLIYEGDTDIAYNEIIRLYYLQGGSVFLPRNNISERNSDPFKPPELSKRGTSNKGFHQKLWQNHEQGKEEQILVYTPTETQQLQPYYNTNNLLYNESSIIPI